jgi:ribonucleases P/MRP protein subunit RPP40
VPLTQTGEIFEDETYQEQLLEWLGLAFISSPRIIETDGIDPYLCRYELPDAYLEDDNSKGAQDIVRIRWRGLITVGFVTAILSEVCQRRSRVWMAYSLASFDGAVHTSFVTGNRESLCWECG